MTTNINYTNIDGNYPVAGQDNDSQGFRDNFTNIKNNLRYAGDEITELQNKAILKSSLVGGTLSNDFSYATLYRPQVKAAATTFKDLGSINGAAIISFLDGSMQKVTTGGPLTITLDDFPATGLAGSLRLWINVTFSVNQVNAVVTLPNNVTLSGDGINRFDPIAKTITFTGAGNYMYEFLTVDGGTNFWIIKVA